MRQDPTQDLPALRVEGVGKKFCKNLKWSLFYGSMDLLKGARATERDNQHLRKFEFWAVKDLNFELRKGEVLGILGPNGAGKTTLMKLISGIYPLNQGTIDINGRLVQIFAKSTGMHRIYTGRENVFMKGAMHGMSQAQVEAEMDFVIRFSELEEFIDSPLGSYSSGMKSRLGFAIMLATRPDILIIDEALAVGDVAFREKCFAELKRITPHTAIISISHHIDHIANVCNRVIVMDQGRVALDTPDVGLGIDTYLNLSMAAGKAKKKDKEKADGPACELLELAIAAPGLPGAVVEHGGPMRVAAELRLQPPARAAQIELGFLDAFQKKVATSLHALELDGTARLEALFDRVDFSPGFYTLSFQVRDAETGKSLTPGPSFRKFEVTGTTKAKVALLLRPTWTRGEP